MVSIEQSGSCRILRIKDSLKPGAKRKVQTLGLPRRAEPKESGRPESQGWSSAPGRTPNSDPEPGRGRAVRLAREGDEQQKNACDAILVETPHNVSGVMLYSSNNVPTISSFAFSPSYSPTAE